MQRLSRAESQQRTRQQILDAAAELFLERGFGATSIGEVAETAGFSHGAVYSNFTGKAALGVAVIDLLYEREMAQLQHEVEATAGDLAALIPALAAWGAGAIGDPRWARLELDVAAASAGGDSGIRGSNARRYERVRSAGADILATIADRNKIELPMAPDDLMVGVLALGLGLGLQRAADSEIPGSLFGKFLAALIA
ncbi:TetR family transcriptional regulator [Antrihabitans cavernicola]|uniref:TetR family transcriptional regulator n=1 Tax=Antrihabitans cavernicola TaxID=2495913 RepID=A0A5A7S2V2_9NOCA|nr:TetR family transcriptional regulator [Spelaeibacter cavernicola]KAA0018491.1 TetR family transcriptional regulator [Spelaeibacter cavernicola]